MVRPDNYVAFVPLEVPWLHRAPSPDDVLAHAKEHAGPEGRTLWLLTPEVGRGSLLFELFVDTDTVMVATSEGPDRLCDVDTRGMRWLPLTVDLWPACLRQPKPPIDPTGAPIQHVPTDRALGLLAGLVNDAHRSPANVAGERLAAVIRERDHHASRVAELLSEGTWLKVRARAFAAYTPTLSCASCGWDGSPHAAVVDPRGMLRCPRCSLPALVDPRTEAPAAVVSALFEEMQVAVERAQIATSPDWHAVGHLAEVNAKITAPSSQEGIAARRAACMAAEFAAFSKPLSGTSVSELVARFAAEDGASPKLVAQLRWIEIGDGEPIEDAERTPQGTWSCCSQAVCICGAAWDPDGGR